MQHSLFLNLLAKALKLQSRNKEACNNICSRRLGIWAPIQLIWARGIVPSELPRSTLPLEDGQLS